ncbi:ribosomal protein S23 [Histoplasma capsulatum G186AR]|uniref:Ribosomal protein S23 n=1 Tax=Ajellomyces capsulatus TaxID=5037 RepID=A0A8H7YNT3_AJECA|nr:ribosomal protein S23 [Histoplasma capsulatum]QSS74918.1 ribosomal protein S23 [Histoplasma capsulatum G186AR]
MHMLDQSFRAFQAAWSFGGLGSSAWGFPCSYIVRQRLHLAGSISIKVCDDVPVLCVKDMFCWQDTESHLVLLSLSKSLRFPSSLWLSDSSILEQFVVILGVIPLQYSSVRIFPCTHFPFAVSVSKQQLRFGVFNQPLRITGEHNSASALTFRISTRLIWHPHDLFRGEMIIPDG